MTAARARRSPARHRPHRCADANGRSTLPLEAALALPAHAGERPVHRALLRAGPRPDRARARPAACKCLMDLPTTTCSTCCCGQRARGLTDRPPTCVDACCAMMRQRPASRGDRTPPPTPAPRADRRRSKHDDPSDVKATLSFSDGSPQRWTCRSTGHHRPGRHRHPQAVRADRQVHLRPGLPVDRVVPARRSPTSTATRASCCTAATRSSSWPPSATSSTPATCCCNGELPRRAAQQTGLPSNPRDQPHHGQRADAVLPARLPPRRAPDGGDDRPGGRAVGLLHDSTDIKPAAPRHRGDPPDRQDAHAGGDGLQVLRRPALHVPAQRPDYAATSCA